MFKLIESTRPTYRCGVVNKLTGGLSYRDRYENVWDTKEEVLMSERRIRIRELLYHIDSLR